MSRGLVLSFVQGVFVTGLSTVDLAAAGAGDMPVFVALRTDHVFVCIPICHETVPTYRALCHVLAWFYWIEMTVTH